MKEPGVSRPFGFFDPFGLCPTDPLLFKKYRESELKHGRVAMIAALGFLFQESGLIRFFIGGFRNIDGPAIFQYQQAEALFPAFTANVIGFCLAIEGFNIVKGWDPVGKTASSSSGIADLREEYEPGDLKFDPLELFPASEASRYAVRTKELNNGRMAMIAVAGLVAQELVTGNKIF